MKMERMERIAAFKGIISKKMETPKACTSSLKGSQGAGERRDKFCWFCHKTVVSVSSSVCASCPRSFHDKCLLRRGETIYSSDGVCCECRDRKEEDPMKGLITYENQDKLGCFLHNSVKQIRNEKYKSDFRAFAKRNANNEDIVTPIEMKDINERVKKESYAFLGLLEDLKWFHHNICVSDKSLIETKRQKDKSLVEKKGQKEKSLVEKASELITAIVDDIKEAISCPECANNVYEYGESAYFAQPCRRPHTLVWANLSESSPWPAKVIRVHENRTKAELRFFGDHSKGSVFVDYCYLLTKEYPGNENADDPGIKEAREELKEHLKLLTEKFREPLKAPTKRRIRFKPAELYIQQFVDKKKVFKTDKLHKKVKQDVNRFLKKLSSYIVVEETNDDTDTDIDVELNHSDEGEDALEDETILGYSGPIESREEQQPSSNPSGVRIKSEPHQDQEQQQVEGRVSSEVRVKQEPTDEKPDLSFESETTRSMNFTYTEFCPRKDVKADPEIQSDDEMDEDETACNGCGLKRKLVDVETQTDDVVDESTKTKKLKEELKRVNFLLAENKSKQWCAYCKKEASRQYSCCWSTAYCSFMCETNDMSEHRLICSNNVVEHVVDDSE